MKIMKEKNRLDYAKDVVISILGGYIVTFLGILILAFLLLMFQISENVIDIAIIIIYILACFITGFIIGKRCGVRKFLWGMVSGGIYFLILFGISFVLRESVEHMGNDLITVFLVCVGSSTLGGMIS